MTVQRAADFFAAAYGYPPRVIASAPGRVNLIGEHTDYNGGQVLPIAIAQRTWVAMSPSQSGVSRAVSAQHGVAGTFDVAATRGTGAWWDYVHGTLRELGTLRVPAISNVDAAVVSSVPVGAGLSSSAALEVASAIAGVVCVGAQLLDTWDHIATAAHRAETRFVGVPCGVMDQTVSAYAAEAHALRIWCGTGRREQVPFSRSVLIVDTDSPRSLQHSAYSARQASCARALRALRQDAPELASLALASLSQLDGLDLNDEDRRRAQHVITETARTEAFVGALQTGLPVGPLLLASHESLRVDYECSTPELDWVVEFASRQPGVDGARLTGAGWGGCAIAVGTEDGLRALADTIVPAFQNRWRRPPRTWLTRAEEGADLDHVDSLADADT